MADASTLTQLYREVMSFVNAAYRRELRAQGHYNTGRLSRSIEGHIVKLPNGEAITGTSLYYSGILNDGVSANKVPFNPGSGAGKSKLIDGLHTYFLFKGLSSSEAMRAAFATAHKMKEEGMPTPGSFKYTKNGARTKFMALVMEQVKPQVNEKMTKGINHLVQTNFHKTKSETI